METFTEYLATSLGRRGLRLTCSDDGFDAADYRWWTANDAEYGARWTADRQADGLIAGNWSIKYDGGDTVETEFAGRSRELRPRGVQEPEYFRGIPLQEEPPSDYQLAERLHRFLELRRSWKIPARAGYWAGLMSPGSSVPPRAGGVGYRPELGAFGRLTVEPRACRVGRRDVRTSWRRRGSPPR